ncbi:MAG: sigma-54 dependent transcriptional regulator [Candidatus Cloacimonetes bacterium]|nr:sigma-54 dependent transcriptional regulator [Candidatus Cloacimonadota bacterium]
MNKILILEDNPDLLEFYSDLLKKADYDVRTSSNSDEFFDWYERFHPDLLILDIKLNNSRLSGIQVFERLKLENNFTSQVIILSGEASRSEVAHSIKLGAYTFIEKSSGFNSMKFLNEVKQALKLKQQQQLSSALTTDKENLRYDLIREAPLIGKSSAIMQVKDRIARFAAGNVDVLIQGETGTGKDIVARQLYLQSERLGKPYVVVNSGGMPETLIDSELFGHKKGSFTGAVNDKQGFFEQASGGVLFLDEISNINANVQAKILRAIEQKEIRIVGGDTKKVDVRLIFACNKNLLKLVKEKSFRKDLFFRLDGNIIQLPPLRARSDDILILFHYFCEKYKQDQSGSFDIDLKKLRSEFLAYHWPGNVRELKKLTEYLFVMYDHFDNDIVIKELKRRKTGRQETIFNDIETIIANQDYEEATAEFDKKYLQYHLRRHNNKVSKVAKILNLNRSTIYQKINKYGIEI